MSEFGHLSSGRPTPTHKYTRLQREALTPLMAVLSRAVQRRVYGCALDPHAPMLVPGETRPGTMSLQRTALTGFPGALQSSDTML